VRGPVCEAPPLSGRMPAFAGRSPCTWYAQAANVLIGVYLAYSLAFTPAHPIRQPWTWLDMAGAAIAWGGLGLRWWSQNQLGRLFTFEVGIRKGHKLVQSGPYAILRHPSYTGLAVGLAGVALFLRRAARPRAVCLHFVQRMHFNGRLVFGHAGSGQCQHTGRSASVWSALHWVRSRSSTSGNQSSIERVPWCMGPMYGCHCAGVRISNEEQTLAREFGGQWTEYCARTWRLVPYVW